MARPERLAASPGDFCSSVPVLVTESATWRARCSRHPLNLLWSSQQCDQLIVPFETRTEIVENMAGGRPKRSASRTG